MQLLSGVPPTYLPNLHTLYNLDHNPDSICATFSNAEFMFFTVNGSDVYMNSCLYSNGTSFVEALFEDFGE